MENNQINIKLDRNRKRYVNAKVEISTYYNLLIEIIIAWQKEGNIMQLCMTKFFLRF